MNTNNYNTQLWQSMYWLNDGEWYRYLDWDKEDPSADKIPRYEIIFDYQGLRFYCFVDAQNVDEALGIFFRHHRNVTYDHVVDHIEI